MKDDPSNLSMLELFRVEAENQIALLTSGLLELERGPASPVQLESLMRAAHSLKGAARIVNLPPAVRVAHAMEDCFVAAQQGQLELRHPHVDLLLRGVDLLANISKHTEQDPAAWEAGYAPNIEDFVSSVARLRPAIGETAKRNPTPTRRFAGSPILRFCPPLRRANTKRPTACCGSPQRISIGCSVWRASRSSNHGGCVRFPNPCSGSNGCKRIRNARSRACANRSQAKICPKPRGRG